MKAISITVNLMFQLKVLTINKSKDTNKKISNCTLHLLTFSLDMTLIFWPIFVDFQNEAAGLCVNNSINKDVK